MTPSAEAREAAAGFRIEHHLGCAPIADLVTVLETVPGVHVAVMPGGSPDHHGMRASDPVRGVTVLGAAATPHPVRLRSTLAHELGHHLFGDPTPESWSERTIEEQRADEFARHLLIPIEGLAELLGEPRASAVTESVLSKVVEWFAVSPKMACIQLVEAKYLRRNDANSFEYLTTAMLATRYGWSALYRQWEADSQVVRPPRRIVAASINAYVRGDATIETLANIHGTEVNQLRTELANAGITPVVTQDEDEQDVADDFDWSELHTEEPSSD